MFHPVDEDILDRFRRQMLGPEVWTHEMHLRVSWMHLRLYGVAKTIDRLREGITRLNESHGTVNGPDSGYHETITRIWTMILDAADAGDAEPATTSMEFVERHPELLDRRLPLRYYTRDRIMSSEARAGWVEPDITDDLCELRKSSLT